MASDEAFAGLSADRRSDEERIYGASFQKRSRVDHKVPQAGITR
jgi:hypothetical protein